MRDISEGSRASLATSLGLGHPGAAAEEEALCGGSCGGGGELVLAGCPLAVAKLLVLPVRVSGGVIYPQTVFLEQLGDTPAGWGPRAGGKGHEKSRRRKGWPFGA